MSTASTRCRVLEALVERLSAISVNAGFKTDAGAAIVFGEAPQLGDADPPEAIAIVIGEDDPTAQAPIAMMVRTPFEVHAVAKVTPADPFTPVEAVLADIKRAVELPDRSFGGLVSKAERGASRSSPREPGATTAAVAITYVLTWKEGWGVP